MKVQTNLPIACGQEAINTRLAKAFAEVRLSSTYVRTRWMLHYEKRIKHPTDQASHLASWYQLLILGDV